MRDENIQIEKIGRYLAGEMSPEEEAVLMDWVSRTPANKEFFEEMQNLWQTAGDYHPQPQVETTDAWRRFEATLDEAAAPPPAARVRKMTGLRVLLRIAAMLIPAALVLWWLNDDRSPARPTELIQARTGQDERRELTLPDGSVVLLNQLSELTFHENDAERFVTLHGEAFFDVQRKEGKPFVIQSGDARISVLGTSFNVRAYLGEERVEVSVSSGKVQVEAVPAPEQKKVLEAGQAAVMQNETHAVDLVETIATNADAWKTRRLRFEENTLAEVASTLERYFGVPVRFDDPALGRCRFSGEYDDPNLADIARALAFAMDLKMEVSSSAGYRFSGEGCN